jgi:hypothetical protein
MGTTAQKLAALAEVKADIADAITAKGGTVPTKFADYATAISNLPTGGGKFKETVSAQTHASPTWTLTESDFAGVTDIRDYAFRDCEGLTSVTLPSGVTKIGYWAFYSCYRLASVTIPDTVTWLDGTSFAYCQNLATIDFGSTRSTIPTLDDASSLQGLANNYQILVPSALLTAWKAASGWSNFASHIFAHP